MDFKPTLRKFGSKNILVVGDVILDQYIQGSVSRISPEAPVPVVLEKERFYVPGGAANVAHNLAGLGVKVTLAGRIGQDEEGRIFKSALQKQKINTRAIFSDKRLPTILKTRVIAQHQQVVRVDREKSNLKGDNAIITKIKTYIKNHIKAYDAIVISDYGKGLITPEMIDFLMRLASENNVVVTVDPKVEHFTYYSNVTAITPNLTEAENAIRNIKVTESSRKRLKINFDKLVTDEQINEAGNKLLAYLKLDCLLITLGERGMRVFQKNKPVHAISTKAIEVYDVSGAGDAVIAVFTLGIACGLTKIQAAELANIAAGIVVGKLGTAAVTKKELAEAVK